MGALHSRFLGERAAILAGVACACAALAVMAFAARTWVVFAIMPLFAPGGVDVPALQSFATRQVGEGSRASSRGSWPRP